MFILDKLFSSNNHKSQIQKPSKGLYIYLDNQLKRKIEVHNQTALQYMNQNQFDPDQFLYLLLKYKRNDQIYSKRRLNPYEWFTDCLEGIGQEYRAYIVMGYLSERGSFPRISSSLPVSDSTKSIRSGNLQIYSDTKNAFQECQLRLHYDYLTYYKMKSKQKKLSFIPLQNSIIETVSENKYVFIIKDKFKNIVFKTTSKQDMIGWLLAISQTIKIRSSQIYLTEFDQKQSKKIKQKLEVYRNKCIGLKEEKGISNQGKIVLLDQIGRKAVKNCMQKNKIKEQNQISQTSNTSANISHLNHNGVIFDQIDSTMMKIIEDYLQMCKIRRQKGESIQSQLLMNQIKQTIKKQIFNSSTTSNLKQIIKPRELISNHEFVKVIEQIMKHLDSKYKRQIIEKKYLNSVFMHHLTQDYRERSKINVKTLFGQTVNKVIESSIGGRQQINEPSLITSTSDLSTSFYKSDSPQKRR